MDNLRLKLYFCCCWFCSGSGSGSCSWLCGSGSCSWLSGSGSCGSGSCSLQRGSGKNLPALL